MRASIVFDLDGTLVDSLGDIATAANRMLGDQGLPPLPLDVVRSFVGNGLPKLVERVILHCNLSMDRHAALTQCTLDYYNDAASETTRPYPGVPEALATLRQEGCSLGICTNKPESPARHVLEALRLDHFFDVVFGGDSLNVRKPDPAHLIASFDAFNNDAPRIFVGDSEIDAETADRAQVPFLLFTEGYRKSPIADIPHTYSYRSAIDLPAVAQRVLSEEHRTA